MKKIALMLALAVAAIACQKEETVVPKLELSGPAQELTIPANGGAVNIEFTSNVEWSAAVKSADWCTVSPASGFSGASKVKVTASANETNDNREAVVVLSAGQKASLEVKVVQLQKDALLLEGEKSYEIPCLGGQIKLAISHNVPFTLEMPEWIQKADTKAMEKEEVILNVLPQKEDGAERTGKIVIKNSVKDEEISVKQAKWEPKFDIKIENTEIPLAGGEVKFTVNANLEFKVEPVNDAWGKLSNQGKEYTFKANGANNNFAANTATLKFIPANEKYAEFARSLVITQKGKANIIWSCNPVGDIAKCTGGKTARLAKMGDFLLFSEKDKIFAINPKDGKVVQTVEFPAGVAFDNVCSDDKGNILVCVNAGTGSDMTIYRVTDPTKLTVKEFIKFNTNSYYSVSTGNLRVKGDIDKNAVVTAVAADGAGGATHSWEVKDGKVQPWLWTKVPYTGWSASNLCCVAAGDKLSDGLFYIGYGAENYALYYMAQPAMKSDKWVKSHVPTGNSNENYNNLSTAEFNGKKYLAYTHGAHFNYSATALIVMDVTDPAKAELVLKLPFYDLVKRDDKGANTKWTGKGAFSDAILYTAGDKMYACFVDTQFNVLGAVEFVK